MHYWDTRQVPVYVPQAQYNHMGPGGGSSMSFGSGSLGNAGPGFYPYPTETRTERYISRTEIVYTPEEGCIPGPNGGCGNPQCPSYGCDPAEQERAFERQRAYEREAQAAATRRATEHGVGRDNIYSEVTPHSFHAGPHRTELTQQYLALGRAWDQAYGIQYRKNAREFGLFSTVQADESYHLGLNEEGDAFRNLGREFLNIAVGIDPVTGLGRSAYEFLTGVNMITNERLNLPERALAFVGVVSGGLGSSAYRTTRALDAMVATARTRNLITPGLTAARNLGQRIVSHPRVASTFASIARRTPGVTTASEVLHSPAQLMRGTGANAGLIPREVGDALVGRTYGSFNTLRRNIWRQIADSRYAEEFARIDARNMERMRRGFPPLAAEAERIGRGSGSYYQLHHLHNVADGGPVYDLSNLVIASPLFHNGVFH